MAPKRPKASTDHTLDLLNNINAPRPNTANALNHKRRRATHADIYDIPSSPAPSQEAVPQTEPRKAGRLGLTSRRMPKFGPPNPSHNVTDNEEDQEPSNDEPDSDDSESESDDSERELVREELYDSEDKEVEELQEKLESEAEEDLFSVPIDLFPDQNEDQAGDEVRDTPEAGSGDEYRERPEDQTGHQAEDQAGDESSNISNSESGSEYREEDEEPADDDSGAERRNSPTPTQQIAGSSTFDVRILERRPRKQRERSHVSRVSPDAQAFQSASSQVQEVPESPTIQSPSQNQDYRRVRSDIFSWLTDTTRESVFKENWDEIRRARKTMKDHADPSMKERFRDIIKLTVRLRVLLETITLDPASASTLRPQCRLIASSVFKEAQWIIYSEAPEDEEEGAYLVNQLEAHIVPRLIDLMVFGFKAYKTINDRAARHFSIILDLLWGYSDRISSLATLNFDISVDVNAHSKRIMAHVKIIKDALNDSRLRERSNRVPRRPPRYQEFILEGVESHISCRPWTHAERSALRNGLEFHEGKKSDILWHLLC
jgi:hypothetical protein